MFGTSEISGIQILTEAKTPTPAGGCSPRSICYIPPTSCKSPHFLKRALISIALCVVRCTLGTFYALFWALDRIFGHSSERNLLTLFSQIVDQEGDISAFLQEASSKDSATGYILGELRHIPELHPLMRHILCGANVRLHDQGHFFETWKQNPHAYRRHSSHNYQGQDCFALDHFLFWRDLEGNTRFQFENSPLKGFCNTIYHLIDYLCYLRDNLQQGILGSSPHVESSCIDVLLANREQVGMEGA